jgi:DNA-binding IclR family transcriptional regulator
MSTGIISSLRIRTARVAILSQLADEIGETCNIALPDRDAMIYLDRVETKWPLRIQLPVGSRVPFYCTASGKMYLSSLDNRHLKSYATSVVLEQRTPQTINSAGALIDEIRAVRSQGYSVDRCEFMEGMTAVAVPIHEANGRLVSTLSVHAPEQRFPLDEAIQHVAMLQVAASKLSTLLKEE